MGIKVQNNGIRRICIKTKLDNTQPNIECRLYSDRDEIVNPISECKKFAQKNETRTDMTGWKRRSTGNCARD